MTTERPRGWADAIGLYVVTMKAANRSAGTIRLHRHYLGLLAERHRSPWAVGLAALEAFIANPAWQAETRKSARSVVRGFYRWAHGRGFLDHDPSQQLPSVSVTMPPPRPTPEPIVLRLVTGNDRTAFLSMLAAYMGMRVSEIAQVHGRDLQPEYVLAEDGTTQEVWFLTVHGKGGKIRVLPVIHRDLLARLLRVGDAWAFPNGRGSHLSAGHVCKLLSQAMPERWTGHTMRHRAATVGLHRTRDVEAVSRFLGHARLETTQRYARGDGASLLAVVSAVAGASA